MITTIIMLTTAIITELVQILKKHFKFQPRWKRTKKLFVLKVFVVL